MLMTPLTGHHACGFSATLADAIMEETPPRGVVDDGTMDEKTEHLERDCDCDGGDGGSLVPGSRPWRGVGDWGTSSARAHQKPPAPKEARGIRRMARRFPSMNFLSSASGSTRMADRPPSPQRQESDFFGPS